MDIAHIHIYEGSGTPMLRGSTTKRLRVCSNQTGNKILAKFFCRPNPRRHRSILLSTRLECSEYRSQHAHMGSSMVGIYCKLSSLHRQETKQHKQDTLQLRGKAIKRATKSHQQLHPVIPFAHTSNIAPHHTTVTWIGIGSRCAPARVLYTLHTAFSV